MDIVLTHNNMDFDALAAQFAVTKLYPSVRMILGYPLVGNVREFLALYRDALPLAQIKYVDFEQVNHLYIVDCQHIERMDEAIYRLLHDPKHPRSYTIFDHHQMDTNGLGPAARDDSIIHSVGATTTLLVEQIKQKKVEIAPFDATLLLLGIYEDTGCLTYGGTTATDAECVTYLLEQGADLAQVNDFLHPKLNEEQIQLLERLIHQAKSITIAGSKVVIAWAKTPRFIDGLATLTRKLMDIEEADAVITIVHMHDRTHVVGRSDTPAIDLNLILKEFGGGGHPGAGSAVVKQRTIESIITQVEQQLKNQVVPEKMALEIMNSPVRTIHPRTTMDEAGRLLLRYDLDGLVVTEDNQIVGVVSRRDIDQARHHKLGHAPVQGFMSRPVITINPQTPLSFIQKTMVQEDIGRLPVVDDQGHLIGIVTRREVMHTLFGQSKNQLIREEFSVPTTMINLRTMIDHLNTQVCWLFTEIGIIAAQLNMVAYAVGGCVRDLLLKREIFDLDFVIEGSAIALAEALEQAFPDKFCVIAKHERFQTATMEFQADVKYEIDLSTARLEFYEFPAALPDVEASSLRQDLFRRDFTINALAICLNPNKLGQLIDYFNGRKDLENKVIRILHPFSFIEDPTRIIRAARFAARLGFQLEPRTKQQAVRAVEMGIFDDLGGSRLCSELKLILESTERMKALDLLGKLGGRLRYLDSQLEWSTRLHRLLRRAERLLMRYPVKDCWLVYLALLVSELNPIRRQAVLLRLYLSNEHKEHIEQGLNLGHKIQNLKEMPKPSQIYQYLHEQSDQALTIAACLASPGSFGRRMIKFYRDKLQLVKVITTGADLIAMGFLEGPEIGQVLKQLTNAKLEGKVKSRQDEISFIKTNFLKHDCQ